MGFVSKLVATSIGLAASIACANAQGYAWTGFYGGLHAGAVTTHGAETTGSNLGSGIPVGSAAFARTVAEGLTGSTGDPVLATGGVQFGYNWRINPTLVVGLETDFSAIARTSRNLRRIDPFPGFPGFTIGTELRHSGYLDNLGTVRARFGYLIAPDFLLYVTGGVAYGQTDTTTRYRITAPGTALTPPDATFGSRSMRAGYAIGGGFERAIDRNVAVKIEGVFYDLGTATESVTIDSRSAGVFTSRTGLANTIQFNGAIGRIGINYLF